MIEEGGGSKLFLLASPPLIHGRSLDRSAEFWSRKLHSSIRSHENLQLPLTARIVVGSHSQIARRNGLQLWPF